MKIKIALFVFLLCISQSNVFSTIQINSVSDLLKLMNKTAPFDDWSADYQLTRNLNLTGYSNSSTPAVKPIGNSTTQFTGSFDGQGYSITNLLLNDPSNDYQGLFGYVKTNKTITNLNVSGTITGNIYCGILCGLIQDGTVTNCSSSGEVSCEEIGGGLIGGLDHAIALNSNSSANISGLYGSLEMSYLGGFIGGGFNCNVSNCYSTGSVNGNDAIGGFAGDFHSGEARNCYTSGNVNGTSECGGFCGQMYGTNIYYCHSSGNTHGTILVGGFCGYVWQSTLYNSYSSGNTSGYHSIGGFCGFTNISSNINNCYSTGNTTAYYGYVGGFCGLNTSSSTINYCYSTGYVTSYRDFAGGFCGKTYSSSQINSSFSTGNVNANWGFAGGFCSAIEGSSSIMNCYSTGNIYGLDYVAGFCGTCGDNAVISSCYSIGVPTVNGYAANPAGFIASINVPSTISCNFWGFEGANIMDTRNSDVDDGRIKERSTYRLTRQSSFDPCFDFENSWVMGAYVKHSSYYNPMLRGFGYTIVPTLSDWAISIFIGLLAIFGSWFVWRRIG